MAKVYGPIGIDLDATPDSQEWKLGEKACGDDGKEYVYVQANGAISQYDFVGIDENFQAAKLTTAMVGDGWSIGVAQVAFADNDYGWVATKGHNLEGAVLADCAADVVLYTSGTAGALDDASSNGTKVDGVVAVEAVGTAAGNVEVLMTYPKSTTF